MTKPPLLLTAAGLCWGLGVSGGLLAMSTYENRPGLAATAPSYWPIESRIERTEGLPTLVMVVHPHCPCSRASIEELDRLMAHTWGLVTTHVLFLNPPGLPENWAKTDLWRSAAAIPGTHVLRDDDGAEAARFGAATSGQVVLYDAQGRLLFSGGITASRGHAGDNEGRDTIVALLTRGRARRHDSPVFGCSLLDPGARVTRRADDVL